MKIKIKKMYLFFLILPILLSLYINTCYAEDNVEKAIYTYQQDFRNPFSKYNEEDGNTEDQLNIEGLKSQLNFDLKGIIDYGENKIAVIALPDKIHLIKGKYKEENFKILDIKNDRIQVEYQNLMFDMKIGGEIVESKR